MALREDAGVVNCLPARCCLVGSQGPLCELTAQIVADVFGSTNITVWPSDGLGIDEEGVLTSVQASVVVLGPAVLAHGAVPAFASAGGTPWRCKAGPNGVSAWHVWLKLFVPDCTVLGDGIGLFKRVEKGPRRPNHERGIGREAHVQPR